MPPKKPPTPNAPGRRASVAKRLKATRSSTTGHDTASSSGSGSDSSSDSESEEEDVDEMLLMQKFKVGPQQHFVASRVVTFGP